MTLRRLIALVLLLTVGVSSAEVLFADEELPASSESIATAALAVLAEPASDNDSSEGDDCACLCACGCVNAQVVVAPQPTAFSITGGHFLPPIDVPAGFAKRARARPHLRPPLA